MTEYLARKEYTYSGGDAIFSVPFSYIDKTHIGVYVNGTKTSGWTWLSESQIEILSPSLINGDLVVVARETPIAEKLVTFTDTSILNEDVQNLAQDQVFDAIQEVTDNETKFELDMTEAFAEQIEAVDTAISIYQSTTNARIDGLETTFQQSSTSAKAYMEQAEDYKNQAATSAYNASVKAAETYATYEEAMSIIAATTNASVATINVDKTEALNTISGARTEALDTINSTKTNALNEQNRNRQTNVDSIRAVGTESLRSIHAETTQARDYAMRAVGWDMDVEDNILKFRDRTDDEIDSAISYVEEARNNAINSITAKTTECSSIITARTSDVTGSVWSKGTEAVTTINSAKTAAVNTINSTATNALNTINSTKTSAVESVKTQGVNSINSIGSATTSAIGSIGTATTQGTVSIGTATTNSISTINSTKTNAITSVQAAQTSAVSSVNSAKTSALSEINATITAAETDIEHNRQICEEMAQRATLGWNIEIEDNILKFTKVEDE